MSDQIRFSGMVLFAIAGFVCFFGGLWAVNKDSSTSHDRWFITAIVCAIFAFISFSIVANLAGINMNG